MRIERDGPVTTVIIDRPEVRNAVDRPTAEALATLFSLSSATRMRESLFCGARAGRFAPAPI